MAGPEFFQTMMGRRFYEGDVPAIRKSLVSIAEELKRANDRKEKEAGSKRFIFVEVFQLVVHDVHAFETFEEADAAFKAYTGNSYDEAYKDGECCLREDYEECKIFEITI